MSETTGVYRLDSKTTNLLPCPFCSKTNLKVFCIDTEHETGKMYEDFAVVCLGCGANGSTKENKEEARKAWNMRSTPIKKHGDPDALNDARKVLASHFFRTMFNTTDRTTDLMVYISQQKNPTAIFWLVDIVSNVGTTEAAVRRMANTCNLFRCSVNKVLLTVEGESAVKALHEYLRAINMEYPHREIDKAVG